MAAGQKISIGDVQISGTGHTFRVDQKSVETGNAGVEELRQALEELRTQLKQAEALDPLDKATSEAVIDVAGKELEQPEPKPELVRGALDRLTQTLGGVENLGATALRVADLVARLWPS